MIPVFSIPKIKRRIHSNLETLRAVNRSLGFKTVKSPTPWPNMMIGYKDEYVSEWFEKLVDKIQKNSFPTWEPQRSYTTRVDIEDYKGKRWNIEYQNGDETLVFTLFRREGKTALKDLPTSEFWNDYDAWVVNQPSPWFKFKVDIKKPVPPYFSGRLAGVEYEKISSIKFNGYPLNHVIVNRVARNLKGEKDKYKEPL